ncbi:hypothetical protein MUS1_04080 [Marinomonas ushuaiensis DSM 15871]|uniref:Uncharacterized protein n=1 Tax=Marinomonas ushuaiensis DSM 15871 TaxID=1122207 RepID=X7E2D9_9GAMM|nr:hypothetical protein [Marinomonas ushuaiensis]ETX10239.1 hypothetical protein MUS1_04080 [Marinomonas ushuaiensis DSM 15871]
MNRLLGFFILTLASFTASASTLPVQWKVNNQVIPPQCFTRIWQSSDNYEAFEDQFNIKTTKDFESNPGKYFGKEISSLEPIDPGWGELHKELSLAVNLKDCFARNLKTTLYSNQVKSKEFYSADQNVELNYKYTIIDKLSQKQCKALSPNMPGTCVNAYVLILEDYTVDYNVSRTFGPFTDYVVYAEYVLKNKEHYIIPLKNLSKQVNPSKFSETFSKK